MSVTESGSLNILENVHDDYLPQLSGITARPKALNGPEVVPLAKEQKDTIWNHSSTQLCLHGSEWLPLPAA